ncbi:proline--tRNA ligase [Occallatibacter riparius]|uniref:Proline--tRNA ligase n=1 Tax=Occallatibacter riparius TaxID=1002689 RepID=A0A9J7BXH5_9BACT|nr:proline--tRNA ligase [Occallatibacter riparius]UWZ86618.1 proline--tRNA ligase [Occallatibacter riparius]
MHRWSKLFVPTLREAPADAEVASHKFLLRAGYIRQLGAGIYNYLFLGQRSINKIVAIVREEMDKIGQEFLLPAILPKEPWEESGRWTGMGDNMFRLKDRKGADLCLGMTHEEIMTTIARGELRSYKQLPQIWYQIQTKFRDEPRPKSGLLRVRQFIMKDSYSFDIDAAGLDKSFDKHDQVYRTIFTRCGLKFVSVEADSGAMGGSQSQEFMVYTDAGEDLIASCPKCGYAANVEKAISRLEPITEMEATGDGTPELVHTPGCAAISDVAAFFKISPASDIKCVAYMALYKDWQPVVVFLRGDHEVNETKLLSVLGARQLDFMGPDQLDLFLGAPAGYLGPVGGFNRIPMNEWESTRDEFQTGLMKDVNPMGEVIVVVDPGLEGRRNLVAGANKKGYHLRNVVPGRDFQWTLAADIRSVNEGEACPKDGCGGVLVVGKAVEIGHIFKLGYKYSESMGARVLDPNGKEVTPIMGSYGIGIERILTAAIEQSNDANGFCLPASIAPFTAVITITNIADAALRETGEKIAAVLDQAGIDVLLDDRDERAGVKFKDADLVGIPYRINVGKKTASGIVELVSRATSTSADVAIDQVLHELKARIAEENLL